MTLSTTSGAAACSLLPLKGELDMKHHETLALCTRRNSSPRADTTGLVLNFADVIYLASVGIGMLLKLVQRGRERGIAVRLAAPRPAVRMVLEMVNAERTLPMDSTVDEAVQQVVPVAA